MATHKRNRCINCVQIKEKCICYIVDKFFKDNKQLIKEQKLVVKTQRCLACYFNPCRCIKTSLH